MNKKFLVLVSEQSGLSDSKTIFRLDDCVSKGIVVDGDRYVYLAIHTSEWERKTTSQHTWVEKRLRILNIFSIVKFLILDQHTSALLFLSLALRHNSSLPHDHCRLSRGYGHISRAPRSILFRLPTFQSAVIRRIDQCPIL